MLGRNTSNTGIVPTVRTTGRNVITSRILSVMALSLWLKRSTSRGYPRRLENTTRPSGRLFQEGLTMWECGCGSQWNNSYFHCAHCGYSRTNVDCWQCDDCRLWNMAGRTDCLYCGKKYIPYTPKARDCPPTLFIDRLGRLLTLRKEYAESGGVTMLDRAIFSTYLDCRQLGIDEAARRLISVHRANS